MRLNRKSLLIAGLAAAIAIAPLVVSAQSESVGTPAGDRMGGQMGGHMGERRGGPFQHLTLTDEQRTQLDAIRENTRNQVEAVLTDEQRQQASAAREQFENRRAEFAGLTLEERQARREEMRGQRGGSGSPGGPFAELNLTDRQREQIHDIMEDARAESENVLTDEQRQQLEEWRDSRPERSGRLPAADVNR